MKIFDKINEKVNKRKINYYDVSEKVIREIMKKNLEKLKIKQNSELKNTQSKTISKNTNNSDSNIYIELENSNSNVNFIYNSSNCNEYITIKDQKSENSNEKESENFSESNFFKFKDDEILFNNQNTFDNFLYLEKRNEKLKQEQEHHNFSFENNFDVFHFNEEVYQDDLFKFN